jgi:heme/copper-type cytochrome/quinol oxidase subunit 2
MLSILSAKYLLPVLTAAMLLPVAGPAAAAHPNANVIANNLGINVVANLGQFTPSRIVTRVGRETVLRISAAEGIRDFDSDELGIPPTKIRPMDIAEVRFTPMKTGTYTVECRELVGLVPQTLHLTVEVDP